MGNAINGHIEHAEKTGVCQLSNMAVAEFPSPLLKLTKNLRTLDLSHNKLKALPDALGNFSVLKSLNVSYNRLALLCDGICKLRKLETLTSNNNLLTTIPREINQCASLKTVILSSNRLTVFPEQLAKLKHLDALDLSNNNIKKIPDSIGSLHVLELNLNHNQINEIPDSLAACPRLKVLRFTDNCVALSGVSTALVTNSKVSLLAHERNLFTEKDFQSIAGYDKYMERYTATKKKFD